MNTLTKLMALSLAPLLLCYGRGGGGSGGGGSTGGTGGGSSGGTCAPPAAGSPSGSQTALATVIDPLVLQEIHTQGLPGMTVAVARNGSTAVVSQSARTLMLTPPAVPYFQSTLPSDYGMGLIQGGTLAGHPFVWHNGQTLSYTSFDGVFTDDGFSLAILTNFPTQEQVPLLNFAQSLIEAICNSAAGASSC